MASFALMTTLKRMGSPALRLAKVSNEPVGFPSKLLPEIVTFGAWATQGGMHQGVYPG